jgi:hypothetical protein
MILTLLSEARAIGCRMGVLGLGYGGRCLPRIGPSGMLQNGHYLWAGERADRGAG